MQQIEVGPKYIGKAITIAALRQYIIQQKLTEADTVLLHPDNFHALAAEYRSTYGTRLPDPYFLLGTLVDDAGNVNVVPPDRVKVLLDDNRNRRVLIAESFNILDDAGTIIYRCRYCRNIVSRDGQAMQKDYRRQLIDLLKLRGKRDNVVELHGRCCPAVTA
jgi:hypothetical protein